MARPKNKELNKVMTKKELNKEIRKLEEANKVLYKLYFIRQLYNNKSVNEAAELEDISISTAYEWLNRWNEHGIAGLRTKSRSGRPGSLSDEDKEKLDALFLETEFLTTEKAHQIIEEHFGLDFTLKHTRTILHQLNYHYTEPYAKSKKTGAEERLLIKKTK